MAKDLTNAEQRRLEEARKGTPWRKWGPYLSERQWDTVREDYSQNGDALPVPRRHQSQEKRRSENESYYGRT